MTSTTIPGNKDAEEVKASEGCPICERIWNIQFDALAQLQYNVGKGDEDYLETSGLYGICGKHLRMFNRITSSGISSKLLRYLIRKSLGEDGANGAMNIFREYHRECPVCECLELADMEEVRKIAEVPFEKSTGDFVCLDHLKKVLASTYPANREKILNAYKDSLQRLFDQLKVLETGNYYQVSADVKSSLWRSVEKFSGRK